MKLLTLFLTAVTLLSSCHKEEMINPLDKEALDNDASRNVPKEAGNSSNDSFSQSWWHITQDYETGTYNADFAGIGFNPLTERVFPSAILAGANGDIYESTDLPEGGVKASIEVIRTNKDLERFVSKSDNLKADAALKTATGKLSRTNSIEKKLKITEETVTVIARISTQRYRFVTNPAPFLTEEAFQMIEQDKIDEFLNTYGPMYIESQVLGGDFYYYYTYNASNLNREEKSTFESQAKASIEKVFNIENSRYLSASEAAQVAGALQSEGVYSSVSGYTPGVVKSVEDFQNEITRIQEFVNQSKWAASTMELTLRPWSHVIASQGFQDKYDLQVRCLKDLVYWRSLYAELQYYYNNVSDPGRKAKLSQAMQEVQVEINVASRCVSFESLITPTGNEYTHLKQTDRDMFKNAIATALSEVVMWRRAFRGYYLVYLSHSGLDRDLWDTQDPTKRPVDWNITTGIPRFSWLIKEIPGSKPLHVFYKTYGSKTYNTQNILYTANPEEAESLKNNSNWRYKGIAGYIMSSPVFNSIPLWRYHNSSQDIHTVAANPTEIANFDQDANWQKESILGYVFPGSIED